MLSRTKRAIALDVRQRGRGELEVAEATGELVLLVRGHVLAGKHEQRVFEPELGELGDGRIARRREEDIADDRPERRVKGLDPDGPHDVSHAAMVRVGTCGPALPKRVKIWGAVDRRDLPMKPAVADAGRAQADSELEAGCATIEGS